MKKTLLFALVLGLAVMFAVPAFAFKIESGKDTTFYFGALSLYGPRRLESQQGISLPEAKPIEPS